MRALPLASLAAILLGLGTESRAQFSSCPGGVCVVGEGSSTVRASVRSRSGPSGGGLLSGLGRALLGSRRGGGASAYGSAYGSAYAVPGAFGAAYGAPQVFGAAYAAPQVQTFGAAQTFEGGGSCYSSGGAAPMSYSPYSTPSVYSAPPTYSTPQSSSTPATLLDELGYSPPAGSVVVSIRKLPEFVVSRPALPSPQRARSEFVVESRAPASTRSRPSRRRMAIAPPAPERRPFAVAVRPAGAPRPVEELAGGDR